MPEAFVVLLSIRETMTHRNLIATDQSDYSDLSKRSLS